MTPTKKAHYIEITLNKRRKEGLEGPCDALAGFRYALFRLRKSHTHIAFAAFSETDTWCGSDADIQDALGLKVSQFLGLMGESAPSAEEEALSSSIARRHVERLINRYHASLPGSGASTP